MTGGVALQEWMIILIAAGIAVFTLTITIGVISKFSLVYYCTTLVSVMIIKSHSIVYVF